MRKNIKKLSVWILIGLVLFLSVQQFQFGFTKTRTKAVDSFDEDQNTRNQDIVSSHRTEIVFDMSHQQIWSLWDTGFLGYSDLAAILLDEGYLVSENTKPLLDLLPSLSKGDVLVLGIAKFQHYDDEEIDQVINFVDRGGGVLIIGEHAEHDFFGIVEFQNPLSSKFGITFETNEVYDYPNSVWDEGEWIFVDSEFLNVTDICLYFTDSVILSGNAEPVIVTSPHSDPPSAIVGAISTHGDGRVLAVCDSEFPCNGDESFGLQYKNNTLFCLKMFEWLSNTSYAPSVEIIPEYDLITANTFSLNLTIYGTTDLSTDIYNGMINPTFVNDANGSIKFDIEVFDDGYVKFIGNNTTCVVRFLRPNKSLMRVLFDETNFARRVDESWSGLFSFAKCLRDKQMAVFASQQIIDYENYDAVVIPSPLLRSLETERNFPSTTKYLLLGEAYMWFNTYQMFRTYNTRKAPINDIASKFDLTFTHYTIYDPFNNSNDEPFFPIVEHDFNFTFTTYRSAVISTDADMRILAEGSDSSWGERVHPFVMYYGKNATDLSRTPLIMCNQQVMAIGDLDILTNSHSFDENHSALIDSICDWLILSGKIIPKTIRIGEKLKIVLIAPSDTQEVHGLTDNGGIVSFHYDPSVERWVGYYTIPREMTIDNHTIEITFINDFKNGYEIVLEYGVEKSNLWILWCIVAVLVGVVTINLFCSLSKKKA
jgi:hypothetical protein